jgi:hypothetical protein
LPSLSLIKVSHSSQPGSPKTPWSSQPRLAEPEEGESGRLEPGDQLAPEQAGVEGDCPVEIVRVLRAEGVAGPTMTRIVDGLAQAELAERRAHPSDGRAVEIAATGRGQQLMHAAAQRRIDAIVTGLGSLTPAERGQLASAANLLDVLAAAIRQTVR